MLYEQLFKGLHTHRIRYLVVGAVASLALQDFTVLIASVPDLIVLKRLAGREQDQSDILALQQLLNLGEDRP
jgi:hypothetical protein